MAHEPLIVLDTHTLLWRVSGSKRLELAAPVEKWLADLRLLPELRTLW